MGTSIIKTVTIEERGLTTDEYGEGYIASTETKSLIFTDHHRSSGAELSINMFCLESLFEDIHEHFSKDEYSGILTEAMCGRDWDGWNENNQPQAYDQREASAFLKNLEDIYKHKLQSNDFYLEEKRLLPLLCSFLSIQIKESGGIFINQCT